MLEPVPTTKDVTLDERVMAAERFIATMSAQLEAQAKILMHVIEYIEDSSKLQGACLKRVAGEIERMHALLKAQ